MPEARLRPRADADLVERTAWYRQAGGAPLARRFYAAAIDALRSIERMPGIGSPVLGEAFDVPGLRTVEVKRFPVRWCYFVKGDHLDVVRLLADAQDLPALLPES